jgi:hypothetical protein
VEINYYTDRKGSMGRTFPIGERVLRELVPA